MISVYRAFVRNDDSLGDRAKKGIFEENSEWSQYIVLLSDIMIVWEIQQKYEFLDKTNVFPGDLKISSFFPRFFWLILEVHTSLCLPILVILTRLTEQAKISKSVRIEHSMCLTPQYLDLTYVGELDFRFAQDHSNRFDLYGYLP